MIKTLSLVFSFSIVVSASGQVLPHRVINPPPPVWSYLLPERISTIVAHHDHPNPNHPLSVETNTEAVNDLVALGFHAVKIWPQVDPLGQDMLGVYTNPGIDLIVLRPIKDALTVEGCNGHYGLDETVDYGDLANDLYTLVGNEDKVIVLTGWEADNQIRGAGCFDPLDFVVDPGQPGYDPDDVLRLAQMKALFEYRQTAIQAARQANLHKPLRVYHALEVSHVPIHDDGDPIDPSDDCHIDRGWNTITDLFPLLNPKPDLISVSTWMSNHPSGCISISYMLDYVKQQSQYPKSKIFVGEYGYGHLDGWAIQGARVYDGFSEARQWGVRAAFQWLYRQDWSCYNDWEAFPDGFPLEDCPDGLSHMGFRFYRADAITPAGQAILDLNLTWDNSGE